MGTPDSIIILMCTECSQVYDMDLGALEELNQDAQSCALVSLDSHYVLSLWPLQELFGKKLIKVLTNRLKWEFILSMSVMITIIDNQ